MQTVISDSFFTNTTGCIKCEQEAENISVRFMVHSCHVGFTRCTALAAKWGKCWAVYRWLTQGHIGVFVWKHWYLWTLIDLNICTLISFAPVLLRSFWPFPLMLAVLWQHMSHQCFQITKRHTSNSPLFPITWTQQNSQVHFTTFAPLCLPKAIFSTIRFPSAPPPALGLATSPVSKPESADPTGMGLITSANQHKYVWLKRPSTVNKSDHQKFSKTALIKEKRAI